MRGFCFLTGSLSAFVCQHSIMALALPCKLIIPQKGGLGSASVPPQASPLTLLRDHASVPVKSACSGVCPHPHLLAMSI